MYTIEKIVLTKLFKHHVPFMAYAIVKGPRGGKYLLDEFNLEQVLKYSLPPYIFNNHTMRELLANIILTGNNRDYYIDREIDEKELREISAKYKYTPLIRKAGLNTSLKIAKSIDINSTVKI